MMAEGLSDDGRLITCEVDPKAEAIARRYFSRSPHGNKITLRMGPALETITTLSGPLDLVFIDADKINYSTYYEASLPLLMVRWPITRSLPRIAIPALHYNP
jgi:caffeoyl-CoA O-methyltransferase